MPLKAGETFANFSENPNAIYGKTKRAKFLAKFTFVVFWGFTFCVTPSDLEGNLYFFAVQSQFPICETSLPTGRQAHNPS